MVVAEAETENRKEVKQEKEKSIGAPSWAPRSGGRSVASWLVEPKETETETEMGMGMDGDGTVLAHTLRTQVLSRALLSMDLGLGPEQGLGLETVDMETETETETEGGVR